MVEDGHIVANHTLTHPDMSKMSTFEDFKEQIVPNEEKYKAITGKDMKKYYSACSNDPIIYRSGLELQFIK